MQAAFPVEHDARGRDLINRTNPLPYVAPYFGYKVHFDQNEKFSLYGCTCTHVIMIDGCSRLITGYAAMPIKNAITIYEHIFRPAIQQFGIWDQVRMDNGNEFCLVKFVQRRLAHLRYDQRREPFRTTPSTSNYVVERIWPEINSRINYPVKRAITIIIDEDDFDMNDLVFKFCLSRVTLYVTQDPVRHFINAWNHHRVPGPRGCVPIECWQNTSRTILPPVHSVPNPLEAVEMFEISGGTLTRISEFGIDPLCHNEALYQQRETEFLTHVSSPQDVFSDVVQGRRNSLRHCIITYFDITLQLSQHL